MSLGREKLSNYLQSQILGPQNGEDEVLDESPLAYYATGILFQQEKRTEIETKDEYGDDLNRGAESEEEGTIDEALSMANQYEPSSFGISFYVEKNHDSNESPSISVDVSAAMYENIALTWVRKPLNDSGILLNPESSGQRIMCLDGNAYLLSEWRPIQAKGFVVTVALVNAIEAGPKVAGNCLYQASISLDSEYGIILPYPSTRTAFSNEDEEELAIRYEHEKIYGIGHGCAVDWSVNQFGEVALSTTFVPSYEVLNQDTVKDQDQSILQLTVLKDLQKDELITELHTFVDGYEKWFQSQQEIASDIPASLRIIGRIGIAIERMRRGVEALNDEDVLKAFQLAQEAMIMQMEHSGTELGGGRKAPQYAPEMPEKDTYLTSDRKWYPFQLAYIILCLSSVVDANDKDRPEVDLIWASTGSGKTEAYLTLAAISIIYRRLKEKTKYGGTVVITRYTLRLLTIQQFERTARLVCALEKLRRSNKIPREEPITIGLWIGSSQTPNSFADAIDWQKELFEDPKGSSSFQLDACPWCGTQITPEEASPQSEFGFRATNDSFNFNCLNKGCEFHEHLPIQVIDEALYINPPTILIGTVDKFARLAWEEKAGNFFGSDNRLPPSLIIQDELHLLSGPLGSTTGIYEAGLSTLCELRGQAPKILASTATIREAEAQIQAIYGRSSLLFPPAGLDSRDSYFTRENRNRPGRTYIGILCPSKTGTTAKVWTSAILLQSNAEINYENDEEQDAYWTLVAYHNSKRELGASVTDGIDSIPGRLKFLYPPVPDESEGNDGPSEERKERILSPDQVMELSANIPSARIPDALARLSSQMHEEDAVGFAPCTNMFSVGVDVQRLGLMLVVGQPMQASEYIQATSRVGRGKTPGVVVSLFSPTKPRDRSHYEQFRSFHGALYRWVEPTSVTPFSLASRQRSLAAVFVILIRHGLKFAKNSDAAKFHEIPTNDVENIISLLCEHCKRSDPEETENLRIHLHRLADEWKERSQNNDLPDFSYSARGGGSDRTLLKNFGDKYGMWPALNSLRNVDVESPLEIIQWRSPYE